MPVLDYDKRKVSKMQTISNMKSKLGMLAAVAVPAIALSILVVAPAQATMYLYNVSVNTSDLSLPANAASTPYSLFFVLTDGSGTGDANNTVVASNFNVPGPASSVSLTDSSFFNPDTESFTPGSVLNFTVSATNNPDIGGTNDQYLFYIDDKNGDAIPTTDSNSSSLFTLDLGGDTPVVTTFTGTGNYSDTTVTATSVVPEPSPVITLGAAFLGLGGLIMLRRRSQVSVKA